MSERLDTRGQISLSEIETAWGKLSRRLKVTLSSCWEYIGHTDSRGYGQMRIPGGRAILVHRIAYMSRYGQIPVGKGRLDSVVMHACDNKICCNPDHLFFGTQADNMRDMRDKGRRKNIGVGAENGRAKVKPVQAAAIRNDTRPQRVIAAEYGISESQVWRIRKGLQWVSIRTVT